MRSQKIFFGMAVATLIPILLGPMPITAAKTPDVTFPCGKMPEICTNICWAWKCASPKFPLRLTWDGTPSNGPIARKRRESAGCGPPNRCNQSKDKDALHRGVKYPSCDEYPFATTAESRYPDGHQVSRCVSNYEQKVQGGILSVAYKRWRKQGFKSHSLQVGLGSPGLMSVNHCSGSCRKDKWQVQDGKHGKRDISEHDEKEVKFHFYRAKSGLELLTREELTIGDSFERQLDEGEIMPVGFLHEEIDGDMWLTDVVEAEISEPSTNRTYKSYES